MASLSGTLLNSRGPDVRKHDKHDSISVDTLMKYLSRLTTVVENKLSTAFPSKFSIVFDDRTVLDMQHIAKFTTLPRYEKSAYCQILLELSSTEKET